MRWLSRISKAGMLGGVLFLALLTVLWVEHNTPLDLPVPTGLFVVGRLVTASMDEDRREIVIWIWYPAAVGRSVPTRDDYLPPPLRAAVERDRGTLISQFLTRDLSKVYGHSYHEPDVSPQQQSYPVVMIRAGASAEVWNYSTLAEDLASHGYVVVGFDVPYRTNVVVFPDGRVVKRTPENNPELCLGRQDQEACANKLIMKWTADVGFVLDQLKRLNTSGKFTGRLDLTHVGVLGHSFGGATAAQFCSQDSRCKAGIDIDGSLHGSVIQTGISKPFLFLMADHSKETDPESLQIQADIQSVYRRLPPDGKLKAVIRGANHFLFSDDGALLKSHIVMRTLRAFGVIGIDGRRQLAVTAYCVHSLFDAYLKGKGISPLNFSSPFYPEIQLVS
ncbi:MAG: dienelactone hydrolase family protein [Acidobacteriaceae bacterium]|nr:dienelactone hydrolase family protein [Acidobacteriaceae bacterium]